MAEATALRTDLMTVPGHVSPDLVFDFDIYSDSRWGAELHASQSFLHREAPDVFYTPRNGGHWIVTRFEQVQQITQDPAHFSVREMQIPRVPEPPVFLPLSLDPPDNQAYRQALMPSFSPKAVKELEGRIRQWAEHLVDAVADKGSCDFVHDVTEMFPVSIFMELMGMDLTRLREFLELSSRFFAMQNNAPELMKATGAIVGVMTEYILEKQKNPDGALISQLAQAQINGRPISLGELQNMCLLLFAGGTHTVTNLSAFAYWQLAADPALQALLVAHPERIPDFVDEALRMFGVINTPRIVAQDCERFGVTFREGDMVLCMLSLASRDDRMNADPDRFDIDRKKREYTTFSKGPHLCVGHFLARAELRILTETWLKRIHSFSLKPGASQSYSTGTTYALNTLPLVW